MEQGDGSTICNLCSWNDPQRLGKRAGGVRSRRTSGDHPTYNIVEVGQNTEKSPGDLRRVAVAQDFVKKTSVNAAI